jgi:hypothetical protein
MPRITIDLTPYKAEIIQWARTKVTSIEISQRLRAQYDIQTCEKTIDRRLRIWGIQRRQTTHDTPVLRASIAMLFRLNCTDEEILDELIDNGFQIKKTGIKRIRLELGLARKMHTLDREAMDAQLFGVLKEELDDGRIEGYGRGLLYTYFKRQGRLVTR